MTSHHNARTNVARGPTAEAFTFERRFPMPSVAA